MLDKNICLIPAKAASTRLPLKNILKINGKELIHYGINAAITSGLFGEHVYVSTESKEIREIAEKHGGRVPYLRDPSLSVDPAGVEDVALDFFEKRPEFKEFRNLFIILPTAPMVLPTDLIGAFGAYRNSMCKCLMSVAETEHNAMRSFFLRDQKVVPISEDAILKKSQELEPTYSFNGAVTIIDIAHFLNVRTYITYPIYGYAMPRERSVDIDTEMDYLWAKFLMEKRK